MIHGKRSRPAALALVALLAVTLAACSGEPTGPPTTNLGTPGTPAAGSPTTTEPAAGDSTSPLATPADTGDADRPATVEADTHASPLPASETQERDRIVGAVREDLARDLTLPATDIRMVRIETVRWPDASLGCPQPGMSYAQVITLGYRILLEAGGVTYVYHTGGNRYVRCEKDDAGPTPTPPASLTPTTPPKPEPTPVASPTLTPKPRAYAPPLDRLVKQAIADLSARLGTIPGRIEVETAKAVQWRDSSLGCPQEGMAYLTVIRPGYLIRLKVDGRIYEYHADQERAFYCENPQPPLDG